MPGSLVTKGLKSNIAESVGRGPLDTLSKRELGLGRVTRTILGQESCTEEEWDTFQRSQALYGIFYINLVTGVDGQITEDGAERFAYCLDPNIRRLPVPGEIVQLESRLAPDLAAQDGNLLQNKVYWVNIIPTWNHPHLNALPDLKVGDEGIQDEYFKDQGNDINPLQLCPGDLTVEGRHGQSLRFGGTWYTTSPISVKGTNGKPYAIIRVGQGVDNDGKGDVAVYEDVNKDKASLYFTSEHIIPLDQACSKRKAWKDKQVTEAKNYNKPQILLTSDRLWLNGRDDIELSAKNAIGLTADQVNIDGQSQVSFDATKVYLGNGSQNEKEPVLKGQATTDMISTLVDQYTYLLDTIKSVDSDPGVFIGGLKTVASALIPILKTYQKQLPTLHSKKVYTE